MPLLWTATAIWALLSWRGGLPPWQPMLAGLIGLAALFDRGPWPSTVTRGEARGAACLLWLATVGTLSAWRPQAHVNAVLALGAAWFFFTALRRADLPARFAVKALAGLGLFYAAAYLLLSAWSAWPDQAVIRALAPNQNLLSGALIVPGLLALFGLVLAGDAWAWGGILVLAYVMDRLGSRGALLALLSGTAWFLWRAPLRRRVRGLGLAAALFWAIFLAAAPISPMARRLRPAVADGASSASVDPYLYRRAFFWRRSFEASLQAPWLGHGLNGFSAAMRQCDLPLELSSANPVARYRLDLEHAHSDALELAVEVGWPLLLGLLFWLLSAAWKRRAPGASEWDQAVLESALVAALAQSSVDMVFRTPGVLVGALVLAAILAGKPSGGIRLQPGRWRATALACLVLFVTTNVGRSLARSARVGPEAAAPISWAAALQPLDSLVAAGQLERGLTPPPWAAWAGRHQSEWLWSMARHYAASGQSEASLTWAERAVAERPFWAPGWFWKGLLEKGLGRRESSESVQHALELEPNFLRARAWQVAEALKQGRQNDAKLGIEKIKAALTLRDRVEADDEYSHYLLALSPKELAIWDKKR